MHSSDYKVLHSDGLVHTGTYTMVVGLYTLVGWFYTLALRL